MRSISCWNSFDLRRPAHRGLAQPNPARCQQIHDPPAASMAWQAWHGMALMSGLVMMLAETSPYPGIPVSRAGAVTSRVLGTFDGAVRTPMWIRHDMLVGLLPARGGSVFRPALRGGAGLEAPGICCVPGPVMTVWMFLELFFPGATHPELGVARPVLESGGSGHSSPLESPRQHQTTCQHSPQDPDVGPQRGLLGGLFHRAVELPFACACLADDTHCIPPRCGYCVRAAQESRTL